MVLGPGKAWALSLLRCSGGQRQGLRSPEGGSQSLLTPECPLAVYTLVSLWGPIPSTTLSLGLPEAQGHGGRARGEKPPPCGSGAPRTACPPGAGPGPQAAGPQLFLGGTAEVWTMDISPGPGLPDPLTWQWGQQGEAGQARTGPAWPGEGEGAGQTPGLVRWRQQRGGPWWLEVVEEA